MHQCINASRRPFAIPTFQYVLNSLGLKGYLRPHPTPFLAICTRVSHVYRITQNGKRDDPHDTAQHSTVYDNHIASARTLLEKKIRHTYCILYELYVGREEKEKEGM